MERLTIKKDDGRYYINQLSIDNSYSAGVNCLYGKPIDKLAEFEDFMEQEEFTSIEDLKAYIKLQSNGSKILIQENQELKDMWQKLKGWLMSTLEEKQNSPKYYKFNNVLDKMQELEDRQ